jgi:RNA polymerase sigma-70 factor, ECF subfamily
VPRSGSLIDLDAEICDLAKGITIVALRRLGNVEEARDAAQEVMTRLVERVRKEPLPAEQPLAPLAYAIARNVIVDILRERSRTVSLDPSQRQESQDTLSQLVAVEEQAAVGAAMAQLAPADRDLLRRCFVEGERIVVIADQLGEPADRIRKRKSRALQRLAELLRAGR